MLSAGKDWIKRRVSRGRWEDARTRWWQLQRAVTVDHSSLRWPWLSSSTDPNLALLHTLARSIDWTYAPHVEARIALWTVSLAWPFVSLIHTFRLLRRHARFVTRTYGVGAWRQAWQMAYFANRYNSPPASYYKFRLFNPDRAARILEYVHHYEICNLLPALNTGKPARRLGDKREFYNEATRLELPVAPVVATFREGQVERWFTGDEGALPERRDLVLKAFDLSCGVGFERWLSSEGHTWSNGSETLDGAAVVQRCLQRSREYGCLLQERLFNHPAVEALAGQGLSTVRVVTYRRPDAPVAVLMASLRMPTGAGLVDNFAAGGIAASVDLQTGTLSSAVAKDLTRGAFPRHPDSGSPIAGTVLPAWPEVLALARRAHEQFGWMAFVGWDVVITRQGPVLLEANPVWCVDLLQITHDQPLGRTDFAEVFVEHWRARPRSTDTSNPTVAAAIDAGRTGVGT